MTTGCPINMLTKDLLKEIFKFVKEPYYFRLLFVCRTFREVANADTMWQYIYCRRWNVSADLTQICNNNINIEL